MDPITSIVFASYALIVIGTTISGYYMSKHIGKSIYDELHEILKL
jgi:hypothetical protein